MAVEKPTLDDEFRPVPVGMRFEHGKVVPHLTVEERVARGKAASRETPRASHVYIRQLRDWKGAALVETMAPDTMGIYATICAGSLARAHARSGDRIAIASYLGSGNAFDQAMAEFSETYADQNERDYDAMVAAERTGRLVVQHGT